MPIQAGILYARDKFLEDISLLAKFPGESKKSLGIQLSNDEDELSNAQTTLAAATEKEVFASENARQTWVA